MYIFMRLRTDDGTVCIARSKDVGAIAAEVEAVNCLNRSTFADACFKIFQAFW